MKADKIIAGIEGVTKKWAKQRKAEERHAAAAENRRWRMTSSRKITIKDVAWTWMEWAYLKASDNGRLPALARQIMYAIRPKVQEGAGEPLSGKYFTQTLLPDYMAQHEEECADWNVVFDARGHFREPHTRREVPLGTLDIRGYLGRILDHSVEEPAFDVREAQYPTLGPLNRYHDIAFFEKEGFQPLFEAVQLAERYDIAIMSTKGMSVTASRELLDMLCAEGGDWPVRVLVFHDFDKAGFSIVGTLMQSNRRYTFENKIKIIDVGMRLADIGGLLRESSNIAPTARGAARWNLKDNGATDEEIEILVKERVELNAFTSPQLVAWIEQKFEDHGVKKVVPDDATLAAAYVRASEHAAVQERIDEVVAEFRDTASAVSVPANLRSRIEDGLKADPTRTWDSIVIEIATKDNIA